MKDTVKHLKPTYTNQLAEARRLLKEKGPDALNNPHAMTGRICHCFDCFCCAALQVFEEYQSSNSVIAKRKNCPAKNIYEPTTPNQ